MMTRVHPRAAVVSLSALLVALAATIASLTMGDYPMPLTDVVTVLAGGDGSTRRSAYVILELRLPRALGALAVGAAFGLSGAIVQRVVRNPLASPDIIGINAGAGAAAVFLVVVVAAGPVAVASGALTGALATAVAIYLLSRRRGVTGYRLVLVGIGITAMLTSVTAYLLNTADVYTAEQAAIWLSGSLAGRSWGHVLPVLLAVAALLPVALRLAASLRALELGDDLALALGTRAEPARVGLLATAVALAAVATAAAGPIAFVALAAPQLARRLVRERGLALVTSAAVGAALLACADLAARRVLAPAELPVGVLTTVLGAPLLIWLLARANRIGRTG
ncbi:putative FecCD-family membrane transport protein [Actinoplanes missouriensis 431]|uniref:Putative FecCD-family membrane transport protein n=2 Tax=Actinoplanes missouriensis TaxID=1866 RepID=I0H557_ACTM4|nr:putative FecCD-family membrane transport protein [Actinoplanes missouriensis 431]